MSLIQSGIQIVRNQGVKSFIKKSISYVLPSETLYQFLLRIRYADAAPRPNTVLFISPQNINSTLPDANYSGKMKNFGVMKGDWDLHKQDIEESIITRGLEERFIRRLPWRQTIYYSEAMKQLKSQTNFSPINGYEQTESGLMKYFESLDNLYNKIKLNGFKSPEQLGGDLPKAHIGRYGSFILTHGHHRTIISRILNIDEIPIRIAVRHERWQRIRCEILNNKNTFDPEHPDLKYLFRTS